MTAKENSENEENREIQTRYSDDVCFLSLNTSDLMEEQGLTVWLLVRNLVNEFTKR